MAIKENFGGNKRERRLFIVVGGGFAVRVVVFPAGRQPFVLCTACSMAWAHPSSIFLVFYFLFFS